MLDSLALYFVCGDSNQVEREAPSSAVQAVAWRPERGFEGAADPRKGGQALVVE